MCRATVTLHEHSITLKHVNEPAMEGNEVPTQTQEQGPIWLDYRTAQEYSGLGRTFLWQNIVSGDLRAFKVGRKTRIRRDDLDEFLCRRSAATTGE